MKKFTIVCDKCKSDKVKPQYFHSGTGVLVQKLFCPCCGEVEDL